MNFSNYLAISFCKSLVALAIMICLLTLGLPRAAYLQELKFSNRELFRQMLKDIKADLKEHYYDSKVNGLDFETRFTDADKQLQNLEAMAKAAGKWRKDDLDKLAGAIIGEFLRQLNDPTTYFVPPWPHHIHDFGFDIQMIGDKCYVVAVNENSKARGKVSIGDQVIAFLFEKQDSWEPTRGDLWQIRLAYTLITPQPSVRVKLRSPSGKERVEIVDGEPLLNPSKLPAMQIPTETQILDIITKRHKTYPHYHGELDPNTYYWRIKYLTELEPKEIDEAMYKAMQHKALIIDLRRATGVALINKFKADKLSTQIGIREDGRARDETLEKFRLLASYFFEGEVKIADLKGQKKQESLLVKPRGKGRFQGELKVLVDSDTETIAEIFARMVQLSKLGEVIGDRTSGVARVPTGFRHDFHDPDRKLLSACAVSVTDTDVIMSDGQSLNGIGVKPDVVVLPTADDLAKKRDPVLERAVAKLGGKIINIPKKPNGTSEDRITVWMR